MGSEMCIRDRAGPDLLGVLAECEPGARRVDRGDVGRELGALSGCLLYTSDAADERSSVDLGGRRIIKKKTNRTYCLDTGVSQRDLDMCHVIYYRRRKDNNRTH